MLLPALTELEKKGPKMASATLAASAAARRAVSRGFVKPAAPTAPSARRGRPMMHAARSLRQTKADKAAAESRRRGLVSAVLVHRFPNLQSLTLARCELPELRLVMSVLPLCKHLQHLSVRWVSNVVAPSPPKTKRSAAARRAAGGGTSPRKLLAQRSMGARSVMQGRIPGGAGGLGRPGAGAKAGVGAGGPGDGASHAGDPGCLLLAAALPELLKLQSLDLSLNTFDCKGAQALAAALPSRAASLTSLNLDRVPAATMTSAGTSALLKAVAGLPRLTCLHLRSMRMGKAGARALSDALPACTALETLHLAGNQLALMSLRLLSVALPRCVALKELFLRDNCCGDAGCDAVADVVYGCRKLTTLDMSQNSIGHRGVKRLLSGATNPSLAFLYLSGNPVGDPDATPFVGFCLALPGLVSLDVSNCSGFTAHALLVLQQAVRRSRPAFTVMGVSTAPA